MSEQKPKYFSYIISAVLIIIGIILIAAVLRNPESGVLPESQEVLDEQTRTIKATNYTYIMPEEWEFYENAINDIQSLQEHQTIAPGIVRDPLNEHIVYFATHAIFEEAGETRISVYKYSETDYSFERIWKQTYNADEQTLIHFSPHWPRLGVVGYENDHLLFLAAFVEDWPELCHQYPFHLGTDWSNNGMRKLYSMDLNDPYAGLSEYEPSDELLSTEEGWGDCAAQKMIEEDEIRTIIESHQE